MALNRRSDRRERRLARNGDAPSQNGVSDDFSSDTVGATKADLESSLPLIEALIERGLVTESQIDSAIATDPQNEAELCDALVNAGSIDEHDLVGVRADVYEMTVADLRQGELDPNALALIPDSVAREHFVIPVEVSNLGISIAMANPPTPALMALLDQTAKTRVIPMLAPLAEIRIAIDNNYRAIGGLDHLVKAFEAVDETRRRPSSGGPAVADGALADDAPVVQVVQRILTQAMRDRASDVHIEPTDKGLRVRYRIDGALKEVLTLPAAMSVGLVSRIKIMAGMNIVERRRPQDGQLRTEIDNREVDVRVATLATIWGEKCVMRLLDRTKSVMRLADLGMPAPSAETYSNFVRAPFGMVLCAGPTGSGKTTTLYATLSEISDPTRNVMTIEDPVEYVFPSINQIQTNEQAGLSFATGLRSILRQDPDVILVGEIRDVETARIAVQSALTGHLVLSSLHATDSVSALHRFLDMGIESFLVASSVIGIVGQRLVRRICPSCRVVYTLSDEERAFYEESGGPEKQKFVRGQGCNICSGTGFQGRIGVYELLRITPEIKRLVVGWATQDELRRLAERQGMRSLREEAIELVARDVTTVSEVIRSIYAL
jgi:type IV pilus assembly protein PilB